MILTFVLIACFSLLVFVHELGHFWAARKLGVKVEEFGFGFPPKIWSKKKGETEYSINLIPLGGFVRLKGESIGDDADVLENEPDSFVAQPIWKRAIILSAGVVMNVVLCAFLLGVGYIIGLPADVSILPENGTVRDVKTTVLYVEEGSLAEEIGLQENDVLLTLNGDSIENVESFLDQKSSLGNEEVVLEYSRDDALQEAVFTMNEEAYLGIQPVDVGLVSYPWYLALWKGIVSTGLLLYLIFEFFVDLFRNIFTDQSIADSVAGPVGIVSIMSQMVKLGFPYVIQITAFLSMNLAVFNILPIPALDGGRILFLAIEKIRKKPVDRKLETTIHNIGFIILMVLVVLVTFRDIAKF